GAGGIVQLPTAAYLLDLLPKGQILVSGNGIYRLNPDGSIDSTFSSNTVVNDLAIESDGKFIVLSNNARVRRLLPDGIIDSRFQSTDIAYGRYARSEYSLRHLALQADGKPLIAGYLGSEPAQASMILARLQIEPASSPFTVLPRADAWIDTSQPGASHGDDTT